MKKLTCEMCGSNELRKEDGVFICQSCGCQYSVEEAKKLMIEGSVEVTGTVKVDVSASADALLKRAFMFLEEFKWDSAKEYCDKVLDLDPENAEAYLGKFMAKNKIYTKKALLNIPDYTDTKIFSNRDYRKAVKFGNAELKQLLEKVEKSLLGKRNDFKFEINDGKLQSVTHGEGELELHIPNEHQRKKITQIGPKYEEITTGYHSSKPIKKDDEKEKLGILRDGLELSVKKVVIEKGITSIKEYAFSNTWIEGIILPEGLIEIGEYAFYHCWHLKKIIIPEGVTNIGANAFGRCRSLKKVVLPNSLKTIDEYAFFNCESLNEITIPEGVTVIKNNAFDNCKALKSITLPSTLQEIGWGAFMACEALETITIPPLIQTLESDTFLCCHALKEIIFPQGLKKVRNGAFSSCKSLENIIIPQNVTCVERYAFHGCVALKEVVFPSGLTEMGEDVFKECPSLTRVTMPSRFKYSLAYNLKNVEFVYNTKEEKSSAGCYVATCVYGSYDCPEVWTLRRYRDYRLAQTWYGRAFIKAYYAISPIIVKWFGNTTWFKKMWQGKLNRMVADLQSKGFESTPYEDKKW